MYKDDAESAVNHVAFLETLPYILPCKFCRASLTDYYHQHPLATALQDLPHWMYVIHNCVNDKLRSQGLHSTPNPTFLQVKRLYEHSLHAPWQQQLPLFWDFLFSVGYHHPTQRQLYSRPMPECPPEIKRGSDPCEKNKWNVLPLPQRVLWFRRFWALLPAVLPPLLAIHWKRAEKKHPPRLRTRQETMNWLWRMRCELDTTYHDPYRTVCRAVAQHSSDCATQRGVFTCRRRPNKKQKTKKTRKIR
jgi:hypothetical protein